jgi:hypothetical protein
MASSLLDMTLRTKAVVENLVKSTMWDKQSILETFLLTYCSLSKFFSYENLF